MKKQTFYSLHTNEYDSKSIGTYKDFYDLINDLLNYIKKVVGDSNSEIKIVPTYKNLLKVYIDGNFISNFIVKQKEEQVESLDENMLSSYLNIKK